MWYGGEDTHTQAHAHPSGLPSIQTSVSLGAESQTIINIVINNSHQSSNNHNKSLVFYLLRNVEVKIFARNQRFTHVLNASDRLSISLERRQAKVRRSRTDKAGPELGASVRAAWCLQPSCLSAQSGSRSWREDELG